jgi:hypothetical protein
LLREMSHKSYSEFLRRSLGREFAGASDSLPRGIETRFLPRHEVDE